MGIGPPNDDNENSKLRAENGQWLPQRFQRLMTKNEKIQKLERDLAWWTAKLNRSRKPSLMSMRAMHADHIRNELRKLQES